MNKIKLIIFDVGDTLIDVLRVFQDSDIKILKKLYDIKISKKEYPKIIDQINLDVAKSNKPTTSKGFIKILLKTILKTSRVSKKEIERYDHESSGVNWMRASLFPDVLPVVKILRKKYYLATLSNTDDKVLHKKVLRNTKLHPHFHIHVDSDAFGVRKPHPKIFLSVLKHFRVKPGEAIMVGDLPLADIVGGNHLGIKTVLLNRRKLPYHLNGLKKPDFEISSLKQLPAVLKKLENKSS